MPNNNNNDNDNDNQEPQTPNAADATTARKQPGQSWSGMVEERIRQAQERGDFDNLPGAGQPLQIEQNPYAGERALAYSLLKQNHAAPREIELGREIDGEVKRAEQLLARLRAQREVLLSQRTRTAEQLRAFNLLIGQYAAQYEAIMREARSKILTLNIIAPAAFHRHLIDVKALMQAFHAEFPPLA